MIMTRRETEFPEILVGEENGSYRPLIISSLEDLDFWSDYLDEEQIERAAAGLGARRRH
jgi:hypothetical protein